MEARHCTYPCSIFLAHSRPCPWGTFPPPTPNRKPFSRSRISCSTNFPRWDSNVETFRSRNVNFNNIRGKAEDDDDEEPEEEAYGKKRRWWSDESPGIGKETNGGWEETINGLWVFKVFKSYGWTLPIILMSWLLATGPKAFLMALALPLGQSAVSLALDKLWGRAESKPKRKSRMRRKSHTVNSARVEEEPEETQKTRKGKKGYQSWVVENNGSVDKGGREAPSFGGWDDLEGTKPPTRSSRVVDGSPRIPMEEGKLSRRERKSDTPLLWRLLIAFFPFLGTWTKIL